jgi:hypothetical protein
MIRAKLSFVAAVFGLLFSLGLYGCGDGDDDNSGFPNVQGVYRGTSTQTNSGCSNPANNGTSTDANATVNISSQSGANFSGTAQGGGALRSVLQGSLPQTAQRMAPSLPRLEALLFRGRLPRH